MILVLILVVPMSGALFLGLWGHKRFASAVNILFSLVTFALTLLLAIRVDTQGPLIALDENLFVDSLSSLFLVITGGVAATTSFFSLRYMTIEGEHGHLTPERTRLYLALYQLFVLTMIVVLASNNLGLLWVALEGATLATVLLVGWTRTPAAIKASWKYFILCVVGIAQALFGTILLYFASEKTLGPGGTALLLTHLLTVKAQLEPTVISLAFVFFVVGYGTKVGLVPLHNWLPDAHAEGPTPISAVLSGLLLNVALYAILRVKILADGALHSPMPSDLLMGFGFVSVLLASISMWKRQDIKRLFAYSSIEHMGLATLAFGIGGPLATFAGLLHMTTHSLVKSAIFFAVGHIVQTSGSQKIPSIREIAARTPGLSRALLTGGLAITGLPPFALFASELLIMTEAIKRIPYAVPFLLLALFITFGVLIFRILEMSGGETATPEISPSRSHSRLTFFPIWIHLGMALLLGTFFPAPLYEIYQKAILSLGVSIGG